MRIRILTFALLIFKTSISLFSQDTLKNDLPFAKRNSLQAELLGNGFYLFSVNYERIIFNGNRFKTAGQIGLGGIGSGELNIPIVINEIYSFNVHHIEAGLGVITIIFGTNSYALTGRIGYRYQKPDGHFVFRIGLTPIIGLEKNVNGTNVTRKLYGYGGLAMGYCF